MGDDAGHFYIIFGADAPLYCQIVGRVRYLVASGLLDPQEPLPSIRSLAFELKVAPNTVAKAYETLEALGVVYRRRGLGTFAAGECVQAVRERGKHLINQRIDALLNEARELNFSSKALLELLQRRCDAGQGTLRIGGDVLAQASIDANRCEDP